jgi:hypothetical protein
MKKGIIIILILSLYTIGFNPVLTSSDFFSCSVAENVGDEGEILVTTNKEVYVYGETVNITVTNIGTVNIVGVSKLRIFYVSSANHNYLVHDPQPTELIKNLLVNQSWNYSWNQKDFNGNQVEGGSYLIHFFIADCRGMQASNETNIRIQGPIFIEGVEGGFGASIAIVNIGQEAVCNVNCLAEISGLVIFGGSIEKVIDVLRAGEKITIHLIAFGIGPASIKIMAREEEKSVKCILFGPFVIDVT